MHLYLLHQGSLSRLEKGRLVLEERGPGRKQILESLPARKVRSVSVFGNVGFSTPALAFLLRQGATIYFFSIEGSFYGTLAQNPEPHPAVLRAQLQTPPFSLARAFVLGKMRSAKALLEHYHLSTAQMDGYLSDLERIGDLRRLRGIEGIAAREYFHRFAEILSNYGFHERNRRPPKDAVNAALSYGYALLLGQTLTAVRIAGLHPEIGFLHTTGRRRPALALDLMEEFRIALVDQIVVSAFRRGIFQDLHFENRNGGVFLTEEGRKEMIRLFEARLSTEAKHPLGFRKPYKEILMAQAHRLKAALLAKGTYTPFYLK